MKPSRRPIVTAVYEERRVDPKPDHVASERSGTSNQNPSNQNSGNQNSSNEAELQSAVEATGSEVPHFECDLCGQRCEGKPTNSGLLLWFRGDEMRVEQPPLCEDCGSRIAIGAITRWAIEGDEED